MSTTAGRLPSPQGQRVLEARMAGTRWKWIAHGVGISIGAGSCYLSRALDALGAPRDFASGAVAWRAHLASASSELTDVQRMAVAWSSEVSCMKTRIDGNYRDALRYGNLSIMEMTTVPSAGQALRALREVRGLSAADVAREAGISRQRVSAVESFPRVTPRQAERYVRAAEAAYDLRLQRAVDALRAEGR